ncbi:MAG: class I SAM-dependent methyltransferase, partial [bacterium]|nr:class I SAM-dependent methyltransferase [bacterium]
MEQHDFSGYVARLQEEPIIWRSLYAEISRNYGFLRNLSAQARILEIGPGRGYFADWLLCQGFTNLTLVEIDGEGCDFLRKKYSAFSSVQVVHNDALKFLQTDNETYDLIISRQVIEHISAKDMHALMRAGRRVLHDDGLMVHETINAANVIYGTYFRYIDFSHQNAFTEKSLQEFGAPDFSVACRNFVPISLVALVRHIAAGEDEKRIRVLAEKLTIPHEVYGTPPALSPPSLLRRLLTHSVERLRWLLG